MIMIVSLISIWIIDTHLIKDLINL